jgi:hypothetical protein
LLTPTGIAASAANIAVIGAGQFYSVHSQSATLAVFISKF